MANKKRKIPVTSQVSINKTVILVAVIVILAVIFLISSGGRIYKSVSSNQAEIEDNVKALKVLEEKTPTNFKLNRPGKIVDMEAEKEKILSIQLEDYDGETMRRWYKGTAIIGDSITLRASAYGFLDDDVVCGMVGGALYNCEEVVQAGIALHPYVVFLAFGANDCTGYVNDTERFVADYSALVDRLKEALPDAVFYINGILPTQPGNASVNESFQYRPQLNEALKAYCDETVDVHYIDSDFILDDKPDCYDADGVHPLGEFFPQWLTYMADVAGLSDEFTEDTDAAENTDDTEETEETTEAEEN